MNSQFRGYMIVSALADGGRVGFSISLQLDWGLVRMRMAGQPRLATEKNNIQWTSHLSSLFVVICNCPPAHTRF